MSEQPTLETARLRLRPFTLADAPDVQRLAGAWEVASTTGNIPHPYPDGAAEAWIRDHGLAFEQGRLVTYAITRRDDGVLVGAISLRPNAAHHHAELGYWIGVPYWNQGYATEAARALVGYGFNTLSLHRIFAAHLTRNPASGRVMQKLGMTYEGCLRQHIFRWGQFEDLARYGILQSEWVDGDGRG